MDFTLGLHHKDHKAHKENILRLIILCALRDLRG
jgi:hypothetical protein